jgi:hypothetical protein
MPGRGRQGGVDFYFEAIIISLNQAAFVFGHGSSCSAGNI